MFLSTLKDDQRAMFMCLAHNVVVSDGDLSPAEDSMMSEMRREMSLSPQFSAHYVSIDGIERVFGTRRLRTIVMISLIRLAYADGAFEIEEQCFLRDLSRAFEIDDQDFERIDNWVRRLAALEREAQSFM